MTTDGSNVTLGPRPGHPSWPGEYDIDYPTTERCIPFEMHHRTGSVTWPDPTKALSLAQEDESKERARLIRGGTAALENEDMGTLISLFDEGLSPWRI